MLAQKTQQSKDKKEAEGRRKYHLAQTKIMIALMRMDVPLEIIERKLLSNNLNLIVGNGFKYFGDDGLLI